MAIDRTCCQAHIISRSPATRLRCSRDDRLSGRDRAVQVRRTAEMLDNVQHHVERYFGFRPPRITEVLWPDAERHLASRPLVNGTDRQNQLLSTCRVNCATLTFASSQ